MNRLEQLLNESNVAVERIADAAKLRFQAGTQSSSHALFAPLHYESNYAYPLIIWLHGPGDSENQLRCVMQHLSLRNYVAAAPRGTLSVSSGAGEMGFSWQQTANEIALAEERVLDSVEVACQKFHVAPSRIFLAGYASGGTMAIRVALNHPERFAGALSMGAPFPTGNRPLRHIEAVRDMPLWMAAGRKSVCYSEQQIAHDLRLLHSAGMTITLRQYPCGDEVTTDMFDDMNEWIMNLVCATGRDRNVD